MRTRRLPLAPARLLVAGIALTILWSAQTHTAQAAPVDPPASSEQPAQLPAAWEGVTLEGTSCGRGAPFKYFIQEGSDPAAGIVFFLNGGGVCLKEGPAPSGASGPAAQLHCMNFTNFEDSVITDGIILGASLLIPYFRRDDSNPMRDATFVAIPYCTGDVHAGNVNEPYDYDPDPDTTFDVTHRGHLNILAVIEDVARRVPGDVPVVLTGASAGGFGVIFNYPDFVAQWPRTTLLPDAGIAPPQGDSLMAREGPTVAERWGARDILPNYCASEACLSDTLRLLAAHADHYDGVTAPWRPFGFLQGQQDTTLAAFLEISTCSYELGLRRGMAGGLPENLRAYVPATERHVLVVGFGETFKSLGGVDAFEWFSAVAMATAPEELPADAVDPWLPCNPIRLPFSARP